MAATLHHPGENEEYSKDFSVKTYKKNTRPGYQMLLFYDCLIYLSYLSKLESPRTSHTPKKNNQYNAVVDKPQML